MVFVYTILCPEEDGIPGKRTENAARVMHRIPHGSGRLLACKKIHHKQSPGVGVHLPIHSLSSFEGILVQRTSMVSPGENEGRIWDQPVEGGVSSARINRSRFVSICFRWQLNPAQTQTRSGRSIFPSNANKCALFSFKAAWHGDDNSAFSSNCHSFTGRTTVTLYPFLSWRVVVRGVGFHDNDKHDDNHYTDATP